MVSITNIFEPALPPSSPLSWGRRDFVSPGGGLSVRYSDPAEFSMGADAWKLALLSRGKNVTGKHPRLTELSKDGGFACPDQFQPWSFDSKILSVVTWGGRNYLYFINSAETVLSDIPGLVSSLIWSPKSDRCVVTVPHGTYLMGSSGKALHKLTLTTPEGESPYLAWFSSIDAFFSVGRPSKQAKTEVFIFGPDTREVEQVIPLDPADLAPYDDKRYESVRRDRFSLSWSPSSGCMGYLLDVWHRVEFDPIKNILFLCVYRPVEEPVETASLSIFHRLGVGQPIRVKEKWVAAQIAT